MPLINVTVQRVAYPPATSESEWFILITEHGACKGNMAWRPKEGEQLILDGEWTTYKGEQEFKFSSARIDVPSNPRDQLHYVCFRTAGLGAAAESLIWQHSGENWMNIQERDIPRLNGKVYAEFKLQIEALLSKSEEGRVVAALMGKGATMNMACAAWSQWEKQALGVVNEDCYRLAELHGYGFRDVDHAVRKQYGIADDDKRRVRAAVVYALRRLTDTGDTIAAWSDLFTQTTAMLGGYAELVGDCTSELFEEGALKAFLKSEGVSLKADWEAENVIWDFVENVK